MKSIILIGTLFLISAAFIIQTMDVGISSNLPSKITPGVPVEFEVTINKSGVSGFSKFQMELPAGMTAEVIEAKDGTFSFADQILKIIWVNLPAENPFTVKFKLNTNSDVIGNFAIKGVFSYILNGERQNKEFINNVAVGNVTSSAITSVTSSSSPSPTPAAIVETNNITFERSLSQESIQPLQSTTVTLQINKGKISGFGKITETIPVGFTAEQIETNGGIFSTSGNSIRFLWMTLPSEESFKIVYKLTADASKGKKEITGSFSYVKNDQTMLLNTATNYFEVPSNDAIAQNNAASESEVKETNTDAKTEQQNETMTTNTSSSEVASRPKNKTAKQGVNYRVQICATKKPVKTDYFVKNNNVNVKIYADMHEGWHKFTVGGFNVYSEARNYREAVKESYNISNPFVTAYNDGNRITVQEALTISQQTWVP